jgi:S1-C subfamily serine protease
MKYLVSLLCALLVSCSNACSFNIQLPDQPKQEQTDTSLLYSIGTVSVSLGDQTMAGTVFAIDKNHLISAGHVCNTIQTLQALGGGEIIVEYFSHDFDLERTTGFKISKINDADDLCLISGKHSLTPVKLSKDYSTVRVGNKVILSSSPLGVLGAIQYGQVIRRWTNKDWLMPGKLLISAASAPGSSGGPVLNDRGEVIGVLIAGARLYPHMSICVPVPTLAKFIKGI